MVDVVRDRQTTVGVPNALVPREMALGGESGHVVIIYPDD